MNTKVNSQKSFDAVKTMRSIRDKVGRELEGMTSQEDWPIIKNAAERPEREEKRLVTRK